MKQSHGNEQGLKIGKKVGKDIQDWPPGGRDNFSNESSLLTKENLSSKKKSDTIRKKLWKSIVKKDIPKVH